MDIANYKNIKVNEVLSLTKKRTQYNHYIQIIFYINGKYCSNIFSKNLIPNDKKIKEYDITRDLNEKEIEWFIEYHAKALVNFIDKNIPKEKRTGLENRIENQFYDLVDGFFN